MFSSAGLNGIGCITLWLMPLRVGVTKVRERKRCSGNSNSSIFAFLVEFAFLSRFPVRSVASLAEWTTYAVLRICVAPKRSRYPLARSSVRFAHNAPSRWAGICVKEAFVVARIPEPLWDLLWKRLKSTGDFFTLVDGEAASDGQERSLRPLSTIEQPHVESLRADIKVMASQETQEAYVGVYANRVQRNAYSETQIKSLAKLAVWGAEGLPQSELTKQMDSKGNNFGYVVKVLMERGQIFNKKVTLKVQHGGAATQTSMLYLMKHRPAVEAALKAEGGKFKSINIDGKKVDILFEDDDELIRKVLRYLNNPDGTLEPNVKRACSFTESAGHKLWRRLKQKMINEGLIEEQRVKVQKEARDEKLSVKIIIKKLKELEDEVQPVAVPDPVIKPPRLPNKQYVELSLDKQVLHQLVVAGRFGCTSAEISAALGLNLKKNTLRFAEMAGRFNNRDMGIEKKKVTVGKSSQMGYALSQGLRDVFKKTHRTFLGVDVAEEEVEEISVLMEEDDPEPNFALPAGELARNELFMKRYVWLCTEILKEGHFLSQQAGSFLLTKESKWAQTRDRPVPKEIDHKTVNRLADAAVQLGVIERKQCTVMSKDGKATQVWVFLPFGRQLDDALMAKVTSDHTESFKKRAKRAHGDDENLPTLNPRLIDAVTDGSPKSKSFDKYKAQNENGYHASKLLRCRDIADLICGMIDGRSNEYCSESFARLVKAAESDSYELKQCLYAPSRRGPNGRLPLNEDPPNQDYSTFEPTPENNRRVFAFEEVWNSMSVDVFLTALGSACDQKNFSGFIDDIRGKVLSDLSRDELEKLAGPDKGDLEAARGHLQEVLNKLLNLGVLRMISPAGAFDDGQPASKTITHYLMSSTVAHQVLWYHKEPEGRDMVTFDFSDPRQRRGYWNSVQYLFAMKKVQLSKYKEDPLLTADTQIAWPVSKVKIDKNLSRSKLASSEASELREKVNSPDFDFEPYRWHWENFEKLAAESNQSVETVVRHMADAQRTKSRASNRIGGPSRKNKDRSKSKVRSKAQGRGLASELPEEEEQFILLHPETQPPPTRKRKWYENEDRELLRAWAGHIAEQGGGAKVKLPPMKLPQGIRAPSCNNRLQKLMADESVKGYMEDIKREADLVFMRHKREDEAKGAENADADADAPAPMDGRNKSQPKKKADGPGLSSDIFETRNNEDMASTSIITGLIERVVQAAPERPAEGGDATSSRFDRLSKATPAGSNPLEYFRWLRSYADKTREKSEKARSSATEPSVEVIAAASMVLASLYEVEFLGKSGDAIKSLFLDKHFSAETVKGAVKHLTQSNLIVVGEDAQGQPSMCLSELYKEGTQPPFAPMMLNEDSASLVKAEDGSRILWPLPAQRNPLALAPLLTAVVMGRASFRMDPAFELQPQSEQGDAAQGEDDRELIGIRCLQRNMASIVLEDGSAPKPSGTMPKKKPKAPSTAKYHPNDVVKSSAKHKEAKEAFSRDVKKLLGVDAGNSILKAVVEGGTNGISTGGLQSLLEHNNLSADVKHVTGIKALLQKYGLARLLAGYNEPCVVDAMASQHLVSKNEVPLRPWIDSEGRVIKPLWESLVLKLIDLTSRVPGIRGDYLVASLKILPPQFAREIISELIASGVLQCLPSCPVGGVGANQTGIWGREMAKTAAMESSTGGRTITSTELFADRDEKYCFFVDPSAVLLGS